MKKGLLLLGCLSMILVAPACMKKEKKPAEPKKVMKYDKAKPAKKKVEKKVQKAKTARKKTVKQVKKAPKA